MENKEVEQRCLDPAQVVLVWKDNLCSIRTKLNNSRWDWETKNLGIVVLRFVVDEAIVLA